ncbi:MAG: AMP-binding protein, partial [bacterium]|nr:AMP-binding protein [bacterium]
QLLVEWRESGGEAAREQCIHELFEARAEARPEARAVVSGRTMLSYGELNERANRLAHHLRELGVGREAGSRDAGRREAGPPETVVAIAAERRPEVVVGLLGILKAGGVYLPLDPSYPAERQAFLLDDAGAQVLLVQRSVAGRLPAPEAHGARMVYLDGPQAAAMERQPARNPELAIEADRLAYVIYTSGTTGLPKGVTISHRQVLPVLCWFIRYFGLDHDTRVLQNLSPCFD